MVKLIVLFRAGIQSSQYDEGYNDFLMKLERLPGLCRKAISTVYAGPGGRMPFGAVVEAYFESRAALEAALTSPAGVEAGQTLINFAGPDAVILFADVMEESYDSHDAASGQS
jgi:uncharacterized protein (TIGR02118 family)